MVLGFDRGLQLKTLLDPMPARLKLFPMRVTNGIPLGCSPLLLVDAINSVQTLKVGVASLKHNDETCFNSDRHSHRNYTVVAGTISGFVDGSSRDGYRFLPPDARCSFTNRLSLLGDAIFGTD
jgi:hypothetical protein